MWLPTAIAKSKFPTRPVSSVAFIRESVEDVQERPLRLFELVSAKAASDDEWILIDLCPKCVLICP